MACNLFFCFFFQLLNDKLCIYIQLFYSFFKTMEGKTVTVELKNNLLLKGVLNSVDQYLNVKLDNVEVIEKDKYPQLVCVYIIDVKSSRITIYIFEWLDI